MFACDKRQEQVLATIRAGASDRLRAMRGNKRQSERRGQHIDGHRPNMPNAFSNRTCALERGVSIFAIMEGYFDRYLLNSTGRSPVRTTIATRREGERLCQPTGTNRQAIVSPARSGTSESPG
ncbi:hypothetical protein GCM10011289_10230 [Paludibacterium paludis]|uniref:Uncharacterized protein n=1 Tax=Paludibacterium paludis TaxID=1225769 RepID=A0A918P049_9NEIS|nr:hypothetical protein GCM10011289_10230 [Paludibacterium paludis]